MDIAPYDLHTIRYKKGFYFRSKVPLSLSSSKMFLKTFKVLFLIVTLVQVTQCVRPSSSTSSSNASATLVRGQDDEPNNAFANPVAARKNLKSQAFYQRLDAHNLSANYLRRYGASDAELEEAGKKKQELTKAAIKSEKNVVKLDKLAKQLGSKDDKQLQRLRPNPRSTKIQKKPMSNEVRKLTAGQNTVVSKKSGYSLRSKAKKTQ